MRGVQKAMLVPVPQVQEQLLQYRTLSLTQLILFGIILRKTSKIVVEGSKGYREWLKKEGNINGQKLSIRDR